MVSLGPTVKGLHSPSEKLKIADVGVLYTLIKNLVKNIVKLNQ
jgi:di/tripeptidase